ncbi:isocitrate lyase/PEP mutase family protein [Paractinoplanes rishiriensis]|uniref:Methylisocitrate lyase n=1 Tax=Paractinoplanes rishiriensis TaxID=1050105 RepID=A0A919K336_9ACTN|nr:isocitrate lyase/PEP mutase family protein [Actinoplanes rishiriensis]GIE99328.1 hypothetical protein Ari01nite_67930 [Actinoplanes rishiriensis]
MSADDLRALLAADHVTHVPGIYDPATAALAVRAGHRAVHLSGAAVAALSLSRPDLGFVPPSQLADRATTLVPELSGVPLLADADGADPQPLHAVWTAWAYVRAGISGLILDDGAQPGLAAAKVAALVTQVPEVAVIAKTSGYATSGLPTVIERCRAYAGAGADAVFPEGLDRLDDLAKLRQALPKVPIVVSRSEAAATRVPASDADLAAVGVRLILHPLSAALAALRAVSLTYRAILDEGDAGPVDRLPWAAFTTLVRPEEKTPDARYVPNRLET